MTKISNSIWIFLSVILVSLIISYFVFLPNSFDSDVVADKTMIDFNQTRLDIGVLKQMKPKKAEFIFTNTGENILLIFDVKTSCGCTNVEWTKDPIKHGKTGKIGVVYDAKTVGRFEKSIEVYCNSENGRVELQVFGEVIP